MVEQKNRVCFLRVKERVPVSKIADLPKITLRHLDGFVEATPARVFRGGVGIFHLPLSCQSVPEPNEVRNLSGFECKEKEGFLGTQRASE